VLKNIINSWGGKVSLFFCLIHFSHDLVVGLMLALLPFIREDLGLNYFQSGLLVSAFAVTSGFAQILGGWLGDRIRRWAMVAIGLLGIGLTSFAVGFSFTYITLLIVLVLMGIAAGAYHPSAIPTLSSFYKDRRGKALGLHMIGGSIGFGISPFLGTAIATALDWHWAFIILSIPAIASSLAVFFWLRKQGSLAESEKNRIASRVANSARTGEKKESLGQAMKALALIMTLMVLIVFTSGSLLPFIPLYLVDYFSMSNSLAAIWLGVIRAVGILGSLLSGWMCDRWGSKKTIVIIILATGPLMMLFAYLRSFAALAVVLMLIGMIIPMRETAAQTYIMGKTPLHLQGMVFGIYFGIGMQGQSLLQPLYGNLMDSMGMPAVFGIVALASLTVSIVSIFFVKKL
jgi:MFS family permease